MNHLKEEYVKEVTPLLVEKFDYSSVMQAPKVDEVVIDIGMGDTVPDAKSLDRAAEELALVIDQKPLITKVRKSIAGFRSREEMPIDAKVTLRGKRMHELLDKLVTASLPRVRDPHGVDKKVLGGRGNYTLGIKEQLISPEVDHDLVDKVRGVDIVTVTTANTDERSHELLAQLGMPFQE